MKPRHVVRRNYHRALGHTVEVYDTHTRRVRTIVTGDYAEERARQRAEEFDREADQAERDGNS